MRPAHRTAVVAGGAFAIGAAVLALLSAASASGSYAAGGDSIATAPALPVGARVTGETRRPEYWRVELGLADQLVVDLASVKSKLAAEVCVLHYDVNDYSSEGAPCRAWTSTTTKRQMRFTAPAPGKWIVVVYGCGGCYIFRPLAASNVAYEFTARVRRYTRVILPPAKTKVGRPITLRGTVQGADGGMVLVTHRSSGRWAPLGTARIGTNGSFAFTTTVYRRGVTRIGAVYGGDDRHRPSTNTTTLTVR
jgi:hypothetical protein